VAFALVPQITPAGRYMKIGLLAQEKFEMKNWFRDAEIEMVGPSTPVTYFALFKLDIFDGSFAQIRAQLG
jgi:hypothetical protein